MADLILPTSATLKEVERELLPRLTQDDPIFDFFPTAEEDADVLMWEQWARITGLQQARGIGGEFPVVPPVALRRFVMTPGYYGEFQPIDEVQLTRRRKPGTFGEPADVSDLVTPAQQQLLQRRLDRLRWILWTMLSTGSISVPGPNGSLVHADSYDTQDVTAAVAWSNLTSATPLADFRSAQLLSRGYSIDFGSAAMAFMNRTTFNYLMANRNASDFWGRRLQYGQTVNDREGINRLLMGEDLPQIVVYDLTWLDAYYNVNLFIPTGTIIILGKRPGGEKLGRFVYTRNAANPGQNPGPFTRVVDSADYGRYPRRLEVYDAFNGGPEIWYPFGAVVIHAA
jgi:hypothetical protein